MQSSSSRVQQLPRFVYRLAMLVSAGMLIYMCWRLGCDVVEVVRAALGILALWGPAGALLYVLLGTQVPDRTIRFTLSALGSYALTTLVYFGLALINLDALFPLLQIVAAAAVVAYVIRNKPRQMLAGWRPDWILIALITTSLVAAIPLKDYVTVQPSGDRTYHIWLDNLYYSGLSYELARHTPPLEQPSRAGLPERAYHLFPHLTTMLIARYSGQPDMLRALQIYNYSAIEALLCLALFSIARLLTGSRGGGYMGAALVYLVALALPPLVPTSANIYYFTLFPHLDNGIDATALPSPQMYSGLVVMYGGLLAVLLISVRSAADQPVDRLLILAALVIGATLRFRLHVGLVMIPGFALVCGLMAWRKRQPIYLAAAAITIILAGALYLEMQSPLYLPGSAALRIGYNGLTQDDLTVTTPNGINSWPFAQSVYRFLKATLPGGPVFQWSWQAICVTAFTLLNIIGIPLLITAGFFLATRSARRRFGLFTFLIVWMTLTTIAGSILLTVDYDPYSVGGQLPPHAHWYVFALAVIAPWTIYRALDRRLRWKRFGWFVVGVEVVALFFIAQQVGPQSILRRSVRQGFMLTGDESQALAYLHDQTPQNAVIMSTAYNSQETHIFSGLTGRAVYAELSFPTVESLLTRLYPNEDRLALANQLWAETDASAFCKQLLATPSTLLVDYVSHPLAVHDPPCLEPEWATADKTVTIWRIKR